MGDQRDQLEPLHKHFGYQRHMLTPDMLAAITGSPGVGRWHCWRERQADTLESKRHNEQETSKPA